VAANLARNFGIWRPDSGTYLATVQKSASVLIVKKASGSFIYQGKPATGFEPVTYRLRIDCTTTVLRWRKADALRECENAGFAMRFYREAAWRTIFSRAGAASFTIAFGPVILT
jgi:hypothetical protein